MRKRHFVRPRNYQKYPNSFSHHSADTSIFLLLFTAAFTEPGRKLQKLHLQYRMVVWQSESEEKKPLNSFSLNLPYPGCVHLQVNLAE